MTDYPSTVPLDTGHNRQRFACGEPSLDIYIQRYATQDAKRRVTAVFVLPAQDGSLKGYYTLSALSIPTADLAEPLQKRLPKHPYQPATLLGRLAVDQAYQKSGLGELLLMDALYRSFMATSEVGSIAVVVDALHERAARFYERYGFIAFSDSNRLFLPIQTIAQLF